MQSGRNNNIFVDIEAHYPETVRIIVKFVVQVREHARESIVNRLQVYV